MSRNKYKVIFFIIIVLVSTLIVRCYRLDASVTSGIITSKDYSEDYWYPQTTFVNYGNGVSVPQTIMIYVPECWSIEISGKDSNNNDRTITLYVTSDSWSTYNIGDHWVKN